MIICETKQERNETRTGVGVEWVVVVVVVVVGGGGWVGWGGELPQISHLQHPNYFSHGKQTTAKDRLTSHVSSLIRTLSATNLYCRLKISEGIIDIFFICFTLLSQNISVSG